MLLCLLNVRFDLILFSLALMFLWIYCCCSDGALDLSFLICRGVGYGLEIILSCNHNEVNLTSLLIILYTRLLEKTVFSWLAIKTSYHAAGGYYTAAAYASLAYSSSLFFLASSSAFFFLFYSLKASFCLISAYRSAMILSLLSFSSLTYFSLSFKTSFSA